MGIEDGVNGTPTILINRRRYDGPRDHQALLAAIVRNAPASQTARA